MPKQNMKLIIYSETNAANIEANIGKPEYSYYYVLRSFVPMLQRFAEVITVDRPEVEVDEIYGRCHANNEICYFLSFSPPHRTITTLRCPTIAVFAWEFDTIPDNQWGTDPRSDWCHVLNRIAGAIVHSSYTENVVKQAMGNDYPVLTVPSPLWRTDYASSRSRVMSGCAQLSFSGWLLDTRAMPWKQLHHELDWDRKCDGVMLTPGPNIVATEVACEAGLIESRAGVVNYHFNNWLRELAEHFIPQKAPTISPEVTASSADAPAYFTDCARELLYGEHNVLLDGIVYTTVLNPGDGRKNLLLLVREFCEAFRHEPQATLVIKSTHFRPEFAIAKVVAELLRQPQFQCRVVVISGYLDDPSYTNLLHATTFALNASYGEGQCLPLMEYMTRGIPVISPDHTALADYVSKENAFVVSHYREPASWPHDPRQALSTFKHQIRASSLRSCFRSSFGVAGDDIRYSAMSRAATKSAKDYCSIDLLENRLRTFLESDEFRQKVECDQKRKRLFGTLQLHTEDSKKVRVLDEKCSGWLLKEDREVVRGVSISENDTVLALGRTSSTAGNFCAELGARVIFLAEDNQLVAQATRERNADVGLSPAIVTSNLTALSVRSESITKVLALDVLERVGDPVRVMKELVRVGIPGACYVLSVPDAMAEQVAAHVVPEGYFGPLRHARVLDRRDFIKIVESAGLVVEDYRQDGFYWSLWMSLYWASQRAEGQAPNSAIMDQVAPPYHELLECWAKIWATVLEMPGGDKLKSALDEVLPQRQTIIARKPEQDLQ